LGTPHTDDQGTPKRSPSRFDPVASMRAMADIQAEGLRAAGALIDRVLGSEPDPAEPRPSPAANGAYAALVDAWADLLRRTADGLAPPGDAGSVTVAVDTNGMGPRVRLADQAPAEVWLHNGTQADFGPLALNCGQLRDSDGGILEHGDVRFEPGEIPLLPARSSRAITISLEPNGSVQPGTYRGTIQARGAPGLWLPLEVVVAPS
jgi:hypothetical protein